MSRTDRYSPGSRPEIARLRRAMTELEERCSQVDPADPLAGDMNRYFCVRTAGFLEQAAGAIARAAVERSSGGPAQAFALSWLNRIPNLRAQELVRLFSRFGEPIGTDLEEFLKEDQKAQRINALMGVRNQIAHGLDQGVSLRQASDYFSVVNQVLDWLVDRLDPAS